MAEALPTIIYVDGENLLHRVKEVLANEKLIEHKTDITKFDLEWLLTQVISGSSHQVRYYGTRLRLSGINDPALRQRAEQMIDSQRRLKRCLERQNITFVACGNLRLRGGVSCRKCGHQEVIFQEKGVDVRIAVDMAGEAAKGVTQYLVSSDSDLLPAVDAAKGKGANVAYVTLASSVNRALVAKTDETRTYTTDQVIEAYKRLNYGKA